MQQVHQVVLVKVAVGETGDAGGLARGRHGGLHRYPQARPRIHFHKVVGGIGVNVVAVPEHAALRRPGMRPGRIEQKVLVVIERVIAVAYEQDVILHQVIGPVGGVGLGQQAHGITVQVQVVGVEARRQAQLIQRSFI